MDCTIHYTDHADLSTDCHRLPSKYEARNVIELPDADVMASLASGGRDIVGSEKTTEIYDWVGLVTRQEVPGLHAG